MKRLELKQFAIIILLLLGRNSEQARGEDIENARTPVILNLGEVRAEGEYFGDRLYRGQSGQVTVFGVWNGKEGLRMMRQDMNLADRLSGKYSVVGMHGDTHSAYISAIPIVSKDGVTILCNSCTVPSTNYPNLVRVASEVARIHGTQTVGLAVPNLTLEIGIASDGVPTFTVRKFPSGDIIDANRTFGVFNASGEQTASVRDLKMLLETDVYLAPPDDGLPIDPNTKISVTPRHHCNPSPPTGQSPGANRLLDSLKNAYSKTVGIVTRTVGGNVTGTIEMAKRLGARKIVGIAGTSALCVLISCVPGLVTYTSATAVVYGPPAATIGAAIVFPLLGLYALHSARQEAAEIVRKQNVRLEKEDGERKKMALPGQYAVPSPRYRAPSSAPYPPGYAPVDLGDARIGW